MQLLDKGALTVRFKPTLDLIDDGNRRFTLVVSGDGECRETPCSGTPSRQRQSDIVKIGSKADQ